MLTATEDRILAKTGTRLTVLFHPLHLRVWLAWRLVGTQISLWWKKSRCPPACLLSSPCFLHLMGKVNAQLQHRLVVWLIFMAPDVYEWTNFSFSRDRNQIARYQNGAILDVLWPPLWPHVQWLQTRAGVCSYHTETSCCRGNNDLIYAEVLLWVV